MFGRQPLLVFPLLFSILFISNNGFAQQPKSESLDPSRFSKYEKLIEGEIAEGKMVGCAAVLMKDGNRLYEKEWGQRDREKDLAVEKNTIWRIYSMSKPITSVAVMQLVEQGKLKLDEPVSTYLEEFKNLKVLQGDDEVACEKEMTVRDLLRHTSGLTYGFFGNSEVDKTYRKKGVMIFDNNLKETVSKLSKIPLLHQPGSRWHYSVSTDVLGRVVEVASGKSFKEYLDENLFEPLEMKDTFFSVPKPKQSRFAQMYAPENGKLKPAAKWNSIRFTQGTELYSGGGGLCSTCDDYLNFCQMLVNEGKFKDKQILKPETLKQMFTNQIPKGAGRRGFQFGLGFAISREGRYSWGGRHPFLGGPQEQNLRRLHDSNQSISQPRLWK